MALSFFALYVASLVVGLLVWAGVLAGPVALLLVTLGALAVLGARELKRRAGRLADDDG